jgi:HAD superfamily hydrolase (TIGR01549 family)
VTLKVITFDLDNTLWDVEPTLLRAEAAQQAWLREHRPDAVADMDHEGLWEFKKAVWQRNPELAHNVSAMRRQMLYELQQRAGYPETEAQAGADAAFAAFLAERHRVELYEEVLEVLESLAGRYVLGALTNGNADVYRTDAAEYFDFAFLAEEVGASKPDAAMFRAAMDRSGASAREIVHVGDNPEHDVLGAKASGLHAVWINASGGNWEHGSIAPDVTIDHVRELPGAIEGLERALREQTGRAAGH